MNFFNYDPIEIISNWKLNEREIQFGIPFLNRITPIDKIGWIGATMSPVVDNDPNSDLIENPINGLNYYKNKGVDKIKFETKRMGSRCCGYFTRKEGLSLYSRKLYNIENKIDKDDFIGIENDCLKLCNIANIDGFIFDSEIEPWTLLSKDLVNRDFLAPLDAYKLSVGEDENYHKTLKAVRNFSKDKNIEIHIFDIPAILINGKWEINTQIINIDDLLYFVPDFNYLRNIDGFIVDLNNSYHYEKVKNWFRKICDSSKPNFKEGIVLKLIDRQLNSEYLIPPYLKCRGKDYLRMVYGINYDIDFIDKLKRRNTGKKKFQSIIEYGISLQILKNWVKYKNGEIGNEILKKLVAGYFGVLEFNAKKINATL